MAENPARKWWALIAIAASVLVVGLDLTVLNLALPTIAADLHASTSDLQWIAAAYSLVLAAAMLPAGLLGDRLGRKKVLLAALVLFGASSAACAYAASAGELIAARAALGIGAAAIFPHVAFGDPGAVRAAGAAEGDRADGVGHHHQLPDRPGRRRLPARPLLVGLGLPDQRARRGAGRGRRRDPAARVAQRAAARRGRSGRDLVQRGAGRADLRVHQGRPGRLDGRRGAGHHRRRGRGARRPGGLGALADRTQTGTPETCAGGAGSRCVR